MLDINLTGEYIVSREAARVMIDRKIKGSIVNIASMSGYIANVPQKQVAYNASKAGAIIWLCSDTAAYANGTDILIDGLYTAV